MTAVPYYDVINLDRFNDVGITFSTFQIDAADKGVMAIYDLESNVNIASVGLGWSNAVGVDNDLSIRIETVVNDLPSGTLAWTGSSVSPQDVATGAGSAYYTLDTPGTTGRNTRVAVVVKNVSATPASNYIIARYGVAGTGPQVSCPYSGTMTGGTWTASSQTPMVVLKDANGRVIPGGLFILSASSSNSVSSSSNPREVGVRWSQPIAATVDRMTATVANNNNTAVAGELVLYEDTAGVPSEKGKAAYTAGTIRLASSPFITRLSLQNDVAMTAGTYYRATVRGTTAGATKYGLIVFKDQAAMTAAVGIALEYTELSSSGVWTQPNTDRLVIISPEISDITATSTNTGSVRNRCRR